MALLATAAETDEIIFSSIFASTPTNISRLSLTTGEVTTMKLDPPIGNAAAATTYKGQVNCCFPFCHKRFVTNGKTCHHLLDDIGPPRPAQHHKGFVKFIHIDGCMHMAILLVSV